MAGTYAIGLVHLPTATGVAAFTLFTLSFFAEDRQAKLLSRLTAALLAVPVLLPLAYVATSWLVILFIALMQPHMAYDILNEILGLSALSPVSLVISSMAGVILALALFRAINTVSERLNEAIYVTI